MFPHPNQPEKEPEHRSSGRMAHAPFLRCRGYVSWGFRPYLLAGLIWVRASGRGKDSGPLVARHNPSCITWWKAYSMHSRARCQGVPARFSRPNGCHVCLKKGAFTNPFFSLLETAGFLWKYIRLSALQPSFISGMAHERHHSHSRML